MFSFAKNKSTPKECFYFCVCILGTQHHLTACGQHCFRRSLNIIPPWWTQNEVVRGTNDVMQSINDVTPSEYMMLHCAQMKSSLLIVNQGFKSLKCLKRFEKFEKLKGSFVNDTLFFKNTALMSF